MELSFYFIILLLWFHVGYRRGQLFDPLKMAQLVQFIDNPGLQYVAEHIFLDLPPQSLAICRLISKPWKNFIDSRRSLILLQVKQLLAKWISIVEKNQIIS